MILDYDTPFRPTPANMITFLSFHDGVVKKVNDPQKRGRVRVEVPGLLGEGKKNWTGWIPCFGVPCGTCKAEGDEGLWMPAQVGLGVAVGFLAGEPTALCALVGQRFLETDEGDDKQMMPKEQKKAGKKSARDATRVPLWKTEAGHTLMFDDRGKSEKLMLVDWTGAGMSIVGKGNEEDDKESDDDEESKPRKGKRRGMKSVFSGTSEKPGELLADKKHSVALMDLGKNAVTCYANDKKGYVVAQACKEGSPKSLITIQADPPKIILTAGDTELVVDGEAGHITVTRQIILEAEKLDNKVPKQALEVHAKAWEEFKDSEGSGGGGGGGT